MSVIGIPDLNRFATMPETMDSTWVANIQYHLADKAGPHYDLRLNLPGSTEAYSWALRSLPEPGEKQLAVEQPVHDVGYMGWSGEIPAGYGKGKVESHFMDKVEVLKSAPDKIYFNVYKGSDTTRYMLMRMSGKDWLLYNYTPTTKTKDIPDYKRSYRKIPFNSLLTTVPNEVWAPKVDGAHNTIVIRPEKRVDVFSYRTSKRGPNRIDHTYRTDLYKHIAPKELGHTIVRAELYVPGQPANVTGGILNSNVWKSREAQEKIGKVKPMMFDVVKFKGKDVEDAPYGEKIEMLKEVHKYIPEIELPQFATTQQQKLKMKDDIKAGRHPLTKEGVVVYKLDQPIPYKSKITEDYDVLITGVFPASAGSKYEGNAIGGFIGSPEWAPRTQIRIGGGLSDELRKDAFKNPDDYIGRWARVSGQMKYDASGKLRMPIFLDWRMEKYKK